MEPNSNSDSGSGPSLLRPAAAFALLSNERGTAVEDTFVLMDDLMLGDLSQPQCAAGVPLFGVYDGHGGGAAAKHCARRLHHLIADQLLGVIKAAPPPDPAAPAAECPLDAAGVSAALRDAFVATDAELKASGVLDHNSGSTALVALLTPATIWLAWAGDSRAVLVRGGDAAASTSDHRPGQREDEKERIEQAGGMLLNNGGLRLMGMLATTRAIGDHDLQPYGLTPVPEVMRIPRSVEDEFLVLASDGLWDKVSPQEAAAFAANAWTRFAQDPNAGSGELSATASGASDSDAASPPPSPRAAARAAAATPDARRERLLVREGSRSSLAGPQPSVGRTCRACKAARVAAAAMTRCARGRRSRDDTTVLVVNLQQACRCPVSWAMVSAGETSSQMSTPKGSLAAASASVLASAAPSPPRGGSGGGGGGGGGGGSSLREALASLPPGARMPSVQEREGDAEPTSEFDDEGQEDGEGESDFVSARESEGGDEEDDLRGLPSAQPGRWHHQHHPHQQRQLGHAGQCGGVLAAQDQLSEAEGGSGSMASPFAVAGPPHDGATPGSTTPVAGTPPRCTTPDLGAFGAPGAAVPPSPDLGAFGAVRATTGRPPPPDLGAFGACAPLRSRSRSPSPDLGAFGARAAQPFASPYEASPYAAVGATSFGAMSSAGAPSIGADGSSVSAPAPGPPFASAHAPFFEGPLGVGPRDWHGLACRGSQSAGPGSTAALEHLAHQCVSVSLAAVGEGEGGGEEDTGASSSGDDAAAATGAALRAARPKSHPLSGLSSLEAVTSAAGTDVAVPTGSGEHRW